MTALPISRTAAITSLAGLCYCRYPGTAVTAGIAGIAGTAIFKHVYH